jgi:chaperone LolA
MRALAIVALVLPAVAQATPEQTLAEVQASYAKVRGLTGNFVQTYTNDTFGTKTISRGTLYLTRPDKMRWDYLDAKSGPKKSIIHDGKTLWVVENKNKQVYQHATNTDAVLPAAIAFLNGGKLDDKFAVTAPSANTLVLVPKQADVVKHLTFVIDPKTKRVVKSIVANHKGDTNAFEFRVAEKEADPKTYEFSPRTVPTYKVIRVPNEK